MGVLARFTPITIGALRRCLNCSQDENDTQIPKIAKMNCTRPLVKHVVVKGGQAIGLCGTDDC